MTALRPFFPVVKDIACLYRGDYVTPEALARMHVLHGHVSAAAGVRYVVGPVTRTGPYAYSIPLSLVGTHVRLRVGAGRLESNVFCELFPVSGFRRPAYGLEHALANSAIKPVMNSCECVSAEHLAAELARWGTHYQ